jgi:predicted transcriptional regulator
MQSLRAFEKDLVALGSKLTYLRGTESRTALIDFVREVGAQVRLKQDSQRVCRCVCTRDKIGSKTIAPARGFRRPETSVAGCKLALTLTRAS